jgi:hypothetical protein
MLSAIHSVAAKLNLRRRKGSDRVNPMKLKFDPDSEPEDWTNFLGLYEKMAYEDLQIQ